MGIAPSRPAARQLVSHKHITVNGEVVNVPSYQLKAGDVISFKEKSKGKNFYYQRRSKERIQNSAGSIGMKLK